MTDVSKKDNIIIEFNEVNHKLILGAYADCCSRSWLEKESNREDSNLNRLIGNRLLGLEYLADEVEHEATGVDECDQFHKYKFITDSKEDITVLLCNSSNGYYDGWLEPQLQTQS